MEKPAVGHPRPLRPHVVAGRVTLFHPGAPGSLPKAARGRAGAWQLYQLPAEKEFCDNGGGAKPGCRLMNNVKLHLQSGRCPVYQQGGAAPQLPSHGSCPPVTTAVTPCPAPTGARSGYRGVPLHGHDIVALRVSSVPSRLPEHPFAAGGVFEMGVSMATERNGAGSRGMRALEPGNERGRGGDELRGMGDARAPLRRLSGTATPLSCPGGGCWPDSAGEAPGRCLWGQ